MSSGDVKIKLTIGQAEDLGGIRPTVEEVAALLISRTYVMGTPRGTFDEDTNPTDAQVEILIDQGVADVACRTGTIGDELALEARRLAALQAAALVESSHFPDQLDTDRSPYRQYTAMYLAGVAALAPKTIAFVG